eukprot:gene499-1906_t
MDVKLALISHEEKIACGLVQEDLMLQLCSLSSLAPTARHSHLGELAEAGAGAHASHDRDSTGSAACHDPAPAPGRRCDSTSSLDTLSKLCEGTNKLDVQYPLESSSSSGTIKLDVQDPQERSSSSSGTIKLDVQDPQERSSSSSGSNKLGVQEPQESSSSGLPAVYPTSSQDVLRPGGCWKAALRETYAVNCTNKLDVHDPQESSSSGLPAVYPTSSQDVFKARRMLEVSSSGDLCCDISSSSGLLRPSSPAAMAAEAGLWCPPTSSGSIIVGSVAL